LLFDECIASADPFSFVCSFVGMRAESEFLEVKSGLGAPPDLERAWSKSLSAFSNSGGGVLIFGLEAPPNQNQISGISLVQDARAWSSRLHQQLPNVVEPQVVGVQIEPICSPNGSEGFVACYIPASAWRPHRAVRCNRQYYIRSGDNSFEAGPSILRALFAPSSTARFEITGRLRKYPDGGDFLIRLTTWLHNTGTATAYDVFIVPTTAPDPTELKFEARDWTYFNTALSQLGGFQLKRPIHPGESITLFQKDLGHVSRDGLINAKWPEPDFTLRVFAANQPQTLLIRHLKISDLLDADFSFGRQSAT
jgi:hypothetical protein